MQPFDETTLSARRRRAAEALGPSPAVVLVGSGTPIQKPGGHDQTYPFLPHPCYYWLSGSRRPGGVMAWDGEGEWTHFVQPVTDAERLWEGVADSPVGEDIALLPRWLASRGRGGVAVLGGAVPNVVGDAELSARAAEAIDRARRPKDAAEVELMRRAIEATAAGHARAAELVRPGMTERELAIELEAEMFRHGADSVGYGTIVGAGTHAAVLHFSPTDRRVEAGDLVLIDAGGSIAGYTADVTRVYPCGRFDSRQRAVYDIVLAAQRAALAACRAGVEWRDVHRASAVAIAEGLRDVDLLRGDVDTLVDGGAVALFYPHSVGHMVGLGVRDVGGRVLDAGRPERWCGVRLRIDMPLETGFIVTVEPGLYFVDAILDNADNRQRFADAVHWDAVDEWRPVGGVRIEDDVLVGESDVEILTTAIPK